jgi:hypothetical protein
MSRIDWHDRHRDYGDPHSALAQRLLVVQRVIGNFLDSRDDAELRVLSVCAGNGSDILGVVARRPGRTRIVGRLVELDTGLARQALDTIEAAGLDSIEVVARDASVTDAYLGAVPADLVLVGGVFGNIDDSDVARTVRAMPQLCARGASVVWTRHRRSPDLTPRIREWFQEAGFAERAFESPGAGSWSVGVHEFLGTPQRLETGQQLFAFLR